MNVIMSPTEAISLFELSHAFKQDELKQRFNELVKKYHPDIGGDPDKFRQIIEAYEILSTLPSSTQLFKTTIYTSHKELKDYLGENILIEIDKYQVEIFVPYQTRIGDTIKVENILPNLTLLVKIKDKNEQPT
jgi:hypothetical protein